MKNKNKKILSLSTIGTLSMGLMPLATAISCGDNGGVNYADIKVADLAKDLNGEKKVASTANETHISVKVRGDIDKTIYQAIATKFNSYHKGIVDISPASITGQNLVGAIETGAASGSLPTLQVVDMDVVAKTKERSAWFKPLDLNAIFSSENSSLYDVVNTNPKNGSQDFDADHLALNSNANKVSFAVPLGYGSRTIFLNTTFLDHTSERVIHSYVFEDNSNGTPKDYGGFPRISAEEYSGGDTDEQKTAKDLLYIQRYINEAGNKDALPHATGNWLGYGPANLFQRFYSIGYSFRSGITHGGDEYVSVALKEKMKNFGLLTSCGIDGIYDSANGIVKEKDYFSKVIQNGKINDKFAQYYWKAFGGFVDPNLKMKFMTSDAINGTNTIGEVEPFANKQSMIGYNAKWAVNMVDTGWDHHNAGNSNFPSFMPTGTTFKSGEGVSSGQVALLSAPYADVSVADSMAMSKDATPAQALVAKRFLKFLFSEEQISYKAKKDDVNLTTQKIGEAVANNFISSFSPIQKLQKAIDPQKAALYDSGHQNGGKISDPYNGVGGKAWINSDSNNINIFAEILWGQLLKYQGITGTKRRWTYEEFKAELNKAVQAYEGQMSIA